MENMGELVSGVISVFSTVDQLACYHWIAGLASRFIPIQRWKTGEGGPVENQSKNIMIFTFCCTVRF
jgi:hypothetical protein